MKSRRKKRLLAMVLCVVMILSLSISVMAEGSATASDGTESEAMLLSDGTGASETTTEPTPEPTAEPTPEVTQTPEATPEVTPKPVATTPTPTPEAVQGNGGTVQTDVMTDESQTSDVQNVETQSVTPDSEPVQAVQPYESSYEDNDVVIRVSAEAGIVPEGAVLSVTPIVKRDVTDDMTDEEKAQVEAVNAQYDLTEKKLTEDSEAKEETMEGFLAYDISFLVNGVEVEPSGDVNVTMEFKQAALPEGVSEDAEVSVKHLKEEAAAVDGVVVEDMAEKARVQTTDAAAVEKVELTAESFSTYTVTWVRGYRQVKITAHYGYLSQGNAFVEFDAEAKDKIPNLTSGTSNGTSLDNYANEDVFGTNDYEYVGAYIMTNSQNFSFADATEIKSLRIDGSNNRGYYLYYKTDNNGNDVQWGDSLTVSSTRNIDVYYVYDRLTTVETVDSASKGISISMFDYGSPTPADNWGPYTADSVSGKLKQGLLEKELVYNESTGEWLPKANQNSQGVRMLFNSFSKTTNNYKGEANNLFLNSVYEQDGYFYYSSFENYAYLDQSKDQEGLMNFTVYDALGTPSDEDAYFYQRGNFMPYNQIQAGYYSENTNLYNEDGGALDQSDSKYDRILYKTVGNNNYYFGMKIESDFVQPINGQVNGEDMIFEFNGDDDMWVFIDGVLVLDLGGIHDAHSGKINFSDGTVEWTDCAKGKTPVTYSSSIKEAFQGTSKYTTTEWDGNTFADYTSHNIQIFYMERGAGASNCKIKFNIQTIPKGQIQIKKQLNAETDPVKYGDVEFGFKLYVEDADENGQGKGTYTQVTNANLSTYGAAFGYNEDETNSLTMNEEGIFYLKPEQTAYFNNIPQNLKYYVQEVDVRSDEYDEVFINGIPYVEEEGREDGYFNYTSTEATVSNRHVVVFTNACSANNMRTLRIDKNMVEGQTSQETFRILVELENSEGTLSPYSGSYWIFDSNTIEGGQDSPDKGL